MQQQQLRGIKPQSCTAQAEHTIEHKANRNFRLWKKGGLWHAGMVEGYIKEIETLDYGIGED